MLVPVAIPIVLPDRPITVIPNLMTPNLDLPSLVLGTPTPSFRRLLIPSKWPKPTR